MQHVLGFRVCVRTACRPAGTRSTWPPSTRCAHSQRACGRRCGAVPLFQGVGENQKYKWVQHRLLALYC